MEESASISFLIIVGFGLLTVSFIPNVDAIIGTGVSSPETFSKKICGINFCDNEDG